MGGDGDLLVFNYNVSGKPGQTKKSAPDGERGVRDLRVLQERTGFQGG